MAYQSKINKPKNLILTKEWIDDNLFRSDGNLNVARLRWWEIDKEEIYLAYNGLVCPPRCKHPDCWNSAIYMDFKKGYRDHCSKKCGTSGPIRLKKTKTTCIKKYGVDNAFKSKEIIDDIQDKIRKTNEASGYWGPQKQLTDFKAYQKVVYSITSNQPIHTLENINLRKRADLAEDAHHLDHRFSIYEGFIQNIPAIWIGRMKNLEMIPARENHAKRTHCSIDLDELFI